MVGQGRLVGLLLILGGLIVGTVCSIWLVFNVAGGELKSSGLVLGLLFMLAVVLPLMSAGGYLMIRGRVEEREFAEVEKERRILNMVQTQGRVRISDVALELNLNQDQIKNYVYDLVGKGLFTGYIDWKEGTLFAKEAAEMQTNKCPNCGGTRELVGKGIVKCEYCGAELFI